MYTHAHTRTRTHTHTHMYLSINTYIHTYIHTHTQIYSHDTRHPHTQIKSQPFRPRVSLLAQIKFTCGRCGREITKCAEGRAIWRMHEAPALNGEVAVAMICESARTQAGVCFPLARRLRVSHIHAPRHLKHNVCVCPHARLEVGPAAPTAGRKW